ncbi:hypothetical protein TPCV302_19440 [Cutibacterium avidum]|nr:hypothetical protein TPCV302_19440 [Cutibacterium avidum]
MGKGQHDGVMARQPIDVNLGQRPFPRHPGQVWHRLGHSEASLPVRGKVPHRQLGVSGQQAHDLSSRVSGSSNHRDGESFCAHVHIYTLECMFLQLAFTMWSQNAATAL